MVREILTVCVGQCGVQMGHDVWRQYCVEHHIGTDGKLTEKATDKAFVSFFEESKEELYLSRNIMIDLQPDTIERTKTCKESQLFRSEYLISGKEDASKNFARGHYTVGKAMIDKVSDQIRKLAEDCGNLQGFVINHSVGGGTGSGLGCLILERLAVDYRKKLKMGFEVYPSPAISTCVMEAYNAVLTTHWLLDHTEVSLVLDNEAIYELCQRDLKLKKPSLQNMNRLITKTISGMTADLRSKDGTIIHPEMNDYQVNLVPFPRLHFMHSAISQITNKQSTDSVYTDMASITECCFSAANFLVKISDFNPRNDRYLAVYLNYNGAVKTDEINEICDNLKQHKRLRFVEWCPETLRIGCHKNGIPALEDDELATLDNNAVMIGNNDSMRRFFAKRVASGYDKMYSQRAYVHWYVGEGMEEGELCEAREDLNFLIHDYLDTDNHYSTEEFDDEDEDYES